MSWYLSLIVNFKFYIDKQKRFVILFVNSIFDILVELMINVQNISNLLKSDEKKIFGL